jgi:hypothetical protein
VTVPRRFLAALAVALTLSAAPAHKTTRIVWVMTDGLRWQELF